MTLQSDLNAFLTAGPVFTDRPSYIDWRTRWRALYATLSTTIHADKAVLRKSASAGEYTGNLQASLMGLRLDACVMMEMRADAKERGRIARAKALGLPEPAPAPAATPPASEPTAQAA